MRILNLYSKQSDYKNNLLRNPYLKRVLAVLILMTGILCTDKALAQQLWFPGGTPQPLTVCENSTTDISPLLSAADTVAGSTLTWTLFVPPSNGTVTGFPVSTTSIVGTVTIGPGLFYTPTPGFFGSDVFVITVSDGVNTAFTSINVTITPLPVVGALTGPGSVCIGSVISLTDPTPGGAWSATNGNTTVSSAGVVTGVSAGLDTIEYSLTNSCGTTTQTISVLSSSTAYVDPITGPTHDCPLSVNTLSDVSTGGSWSASNMNASITTGGGVLVAVSPGLDTISYTVFLSCGVATSTFVFRVDSFPNPGTISGPSMVCVGSTITLTDPVAGGGWYSSNPSVSPISLSAGVDTGRGAGIDTIFYHVINACGTANATYIVTVNPLPFSGVISGLNAVCQGSSITLTDPSVGGTWSISNSHATVGTAGTVTGVTGGVDTIAYTVTNICGTISSTFVDTVHPLALAGVITGTVTVCVNDSITLADATSAPAGVWSMAHTRASISAAGVVTGLVAGLDTVKYTVTNVCNSVNTTYPITVNPLPVAGVITGPQYVCAGTYDTIKLADTISGGVWTSGSTTAWAANSSVTDTGLVTGLSGGIATIYYIYTNFCGSDTAVYHDTVKVLPDSGYISGSNIVCMGSTITTLDTTAGGVWSCTNATGTISGSGVFTGVSTGIDTVMYTRTNVCGSTTARYPVTIITLPNPGIIMGDTAICPDSFVYLAATVPGGSWSISNSLAFIDAAGTVAGSLTPGSDTVTYTVTNMCGSKSTSFTFTILSLAVCDHVGVPQVLPAENEVTLYPNPVTAQLTLKASASYFSQVVVYNSLGQEMFRAPIIGNETSLDVHALPAGMYTLSIWGLEGMVSRKIVKE